jgi:hypothetical protein
MNRGALLFISAALAACGESATPKTAVVASTAPAPTSSVVVPAPIAVVDAGTPIATPSEPDVDARTQNGAAAFLAAVCEHAVKKDVSWIDRHMSPTLRGNVVVHKEKNGDVLVGSFASDHDDVTESLGHDNGVDGTACDIVGSPNSSISGFVVNGNDASGIIRGAHDGYRFTITTSTSDGARTLLAELSLELPAHPLPKHTKKHAFDLNGDMLHATGKYGYSMGRFFQDTIRHEPACVYEQAAHDEDSSVMVVHAVKVDGALATVRVYASTVVSASLIACLETQLGNETAAVFKGIPFDVEYLLRVLIPTKVDPGDGVLMMGNP